MKKILLYFTFASIILITTSAFQVPAGDCDIKGLKSDLLLALKPDYRYASSKVTRFKYTKKEQTVSVEAALLLGQQFKFLFNIAGLPQGIEIKIFDKKGSSGKQLFSLKEVLKDGQTVYNYEPKNASNVYITYVLPASQKEDVSGCLVSILGYKKK
jgi:D-alanine-D-alanine ligase-like ATP-grasp enzyme